MAFENNVQATLQANVAIGAITIDVVKAVAPNKDVPVSGRLTLSGTNKTEIITYTGRTDNTTYWTITGVTKDAESSFGDQAWSAGDACYQALTAADVTALSNRQTATRLDFVATAGQSTKTDLTYTVGNIDCYLNGSKLTLGTDFTATDGVSVTFTPALTLNDEVQLIMDASASGSGSGLASTVATTDPLITSNPSAIGHLWINSTTANAYICTDITTGSNVWINIGSGTGNVDPDSFSGGTYTAVGGYKYRTFTSSGALQQTGSSTVDMLVVAGGGSGAGANNSNGGGGGAGGYLSGSLTLTAGTYNIVIGAGGAGAVQLAGNNGGNTTVSNINAIAIGGGHGGGGARNSQVPASNGGSGGGGSGFSQDTAGGSGTQADSGGLTGFGNDGGSVSGNIADGGGGAGGAGTTSGSVGHGGLGRQWVDNNYYAGGGGAGGSTGYSGNGGSSVGGNGGYDDLFDIDAIVNTGSGGGGSWASSTTGYAGGNGSSGIVIIRYTQIKRYIV